MPDFEHHITNPGIKLQWQEALIEYLYPLRLPRDDVDISDLDRNVIITPYFGYNKGLAGYVITSEGIPEKGTIMYSISDRHMYILAQGHAPRSLWREFVKSGRHIHIKSMRIWDATCKLLEGIGLSLEPGIQQVLCIYIIKS
jgi:hypothetical protein